MRIWKRARWRNILSTKLRRRNRRFIGKEKAEKERFIEKGRKWDCAKKFIFLDNGSLGYSFKIYGFHLKFRTR